MWRPGLDIGIPPPQKTLEPSLIATKHQTNPNQGIVYRTANQVILKTVKLIKKNQSKEFSQPKSLTKHDY